jgi:Peptidase propeptide and YPEB domain
MRMRVNLLPEAMMRTLRAALAVLSTTGCINAGFATSEMTTETPVEGRLVKSATITEQRVASSVAAMGAGTVTLDLDRPGLVERVRVADANARVIALQRMPGGTIVEAELEQDDGRLVYSYKIRLADGRGKVEIDATTAAVLKERRKDGDDHRRRGDR